MIRATLSVTLVLLLSLFSLEAQALTVSPARVEITADPGQVVSGEIELFNEQDDVKRFYASYENFESRGDSGAPYFIGSENGLATWITTEAEVTLAPGERRAVPYTISVPSSAKAGGYFAAIFFGNQPAQVTDGGEVAIGGKIGVLVLLKVSGDIEESAGLAGFGSEDGGKFFSTLPVVLQYGFNNTGGDRVVPRGEIKIKNTLQIKSATLLANEREGSVLPSSTRRFEVVWGEKRSESLSFFETIVLQIRDFHLGWYKAELDLTWGASSQTANATYHFFIIPWQLLSVILPIVVVLWLMFRFWLARFKRRILAEMASGSQ
jgi:hypothetical protein